jgi:hypothetical protein
LKPVDYSLPPLLKKKKEQKKKKQGGQKGEISIKSFVWALIGKRNCILLEMVIKKVTGEKTIS